MDFSNVGQEDILKLSMKVINEKIGENRSVPSHFVFGITPTFPIIFSNLPNQKNEWK